MRIILIGEAPSERGGLPLAGPIGHRLANLAGLSEDEYLEVTYRVNLFNTPQDPWPASTAAVRAGTMLELMTEARSILLGRRVAIAFGQRLLPDFEWRALVDEHPYLGEVAVMPHPSGLNRWWNEPENRMRARRFLRAAFGTEGRS